jgi:EmrB/QacA subfamily drug resistance transporter
VTRSRAASGAGSTGPRTTRLDRRVLIVYPGLMLGTFLAALDQTIVATSLPTIVTDLGGLTHIAWVGTAYLLTSCVSTPIYGKLGDLFGRKKLFQGAIVLFLIGSALCGLSTSMLELILFRALQGLGAGGLMVNAQAIIGDLVPPAERGRYQGFMQSTFAFATLVGPLLGGVLTEDLSWRWVFYVNLPFGAAALVVTAMVLKPSPRAVRRPKIDWCGASLLSAGITAVVLVTSWGGTAYAWLSPQVIGLAVVAVLVLVVFVLVERRVAEPLLPLRLFANPVIRVSAPLAFVTGFGLLGVSTFTPLYQQIVDGVSPTMSGLRLAPMMLCTMTASTVIGQFIARLGRYRRFPIIGGAVLIVGMLLLSRFDVGTSYGFQILALAAIGVGFGLINPVMVLAAQNAVDPGDMGVASSTNTFGRSVGGAFGIAVFGSVFTARLTSALASRLPPDVVHRFSASGINISRAQIDALPVSDRSGFLSGFAYSLHGVFLCGVATAVIGFVLALRLREVPLRNRGVRAAAATPTPATALPTAPAPEADAAAGAPSVEPPSAR